MDASGKTTAYEYDENGQLKYLKDENGEILTEYRYIKAGRLEEIRTAEGINTCYGYDDDGNLTHLSIGSKTDGHKVNGQGAHFNVRPPEDLRNGVVDGCKTHYEFRK